MDIIIIEVTNNDSFNYFFSIQVMILIISIPFVAIFDLIKKAF